MATMETPQLTTVALLCSGCLLLLLLLSGSEAGGAAAAETATAAAAAAAAARQLDGDPYYDYKGKEVKFRGSSGAKMSVHSGTKWCGAGNIATHFDDLGSAFETDKCCRQHDYCRFYVRPGEEKYNFKNTFLYTLSHCECDNNFLNCLKASKDAQAKSVLYYFFYSLRMPCLSLAPVSICVERNWWQKVLGGCSRYEMRDSAVLMRLPQVDTSRAMPAPPSLKFRTNRR